jgi:hypothetical protein
VKSHEHSRVKAAVRSAARRSAAVPSKISIVMREYACVSPCVCVCARLEALDWVEAQLFHGDAVLPELVFVLDDGFLVFALELAQSVCVCMVVCVYGCVCVCGCMCVWLYVCVCVWVVCRGWYRCDWNVNNMRIHSHTHTHTLSLSHTHTHIFFLSHTHTRTCVRISARIGFLQPRHPRVCFEPLDRCPDAARPELIVRMCM